MVVGQYQALARNHFPCTEATKVNHDIVQTSGAAFGVNVVPGHLHAHGFHFIVLSCSIFREPHSLP